MTDHDTIGTDYPTCPHCGTVDQDWWDSKHVATALRADGDFVHTKCGNCDREITITICMTYTFNTEPKETHAK